MHVAGPAAMMGAGRGTAAQAACCGHRAVREEGGTSSGASRADAVHVQIDRTKNVYLYVPR